jgi:hypothetical protein
MPDYEKGKIIYTSITFSRCCKKISVIVLEIGEPIETPFSG